MHRSLLALTLACLTSVPAALAQQVSGGPDADRKGSSAFVFDDSVGTLAAVSISYSPATWREGYDGMIKQLEGGNYTRLGNGWWTTFDTVGTLEIGGTKVEAGSYYLGLAVDKAGAFSLLLFDSKRIMKAGLIPSATALYRGDAKPEVRVPLALAKDASKQLVEKMEIEIAADKKDPATGRFSIRWGRHEASAPVKFHFAGLKAPDAPKK